MFDGPRFWCCCFAPPRWTPLMHRSRPPALSSGWCASGGLGCSLGSAPRGVAPFSSFPRKRPCPPIHRTSASSETILQKAYPTGYAGSAPDGRRTWSQKPASSSTENSRLRNAPLRLGGKVAAGPGGRAPLPGDAPGWEMAEAVRLSRGILSHATLPAHARACMATEPLGGLGAILVAVPLEAAAEARHDERLQRLQVPGPVRPGLLAVIILCKAGL